MQEKDQQAHKGPVMVNLEPGTYHWCACGETNDERSFCDGSHVEFNEKHQSDFKPVEFKVEEECKKGICTCKQTSNEPNCDGSHNKEA